MKLEEKVLSHNVFSKLHIDIPLIQMCNRMMKPPQLLSP